MALDGSWTQIPTSVVYARALCKGTHRFFDVSIRLMNQENRRIDSNHDSTGRRIYTIMIRLGGESILSWFGWAENRYYHDSAKRRIDTIMIQLGGESILSWFANPEKNRFESNHKINENQEIDLNELYQWSIDANRFFCDLWRDVDPKLLIKPWGLAVLYCTCTVQYRIVP